jgi:hypothetical protein
MDSFVLGFLAYAALMIVLSFGIAITAWQARHQGATVETILLRLRPYIIVQAALTVALLAWIMVQL